MNNEQWERDEILPPQLARDLSSLRDSIQANELLRAKLRKQLLAGISAASDDRPRLRKNQRAGILFGKWAVPVAVALLVTLLAFYLSSPKETDEKSVEVVQQRQLFPVELEALPPALTSDARFLAFERNKTVWIRGMDSGFDQELLPAPAEGSYRDPSFSPDGATVAVSIERQGQSKIGAVSFRTREVRQLTAPPPGYADRTPVFSKDGRYIAFIRTRVEGRRGPGETDGELWIMKTDGSGAKKVADRAATPVWSPDGSKLAFSRPAGGEKDGKREIWSVDRNGRNEKKLAEGLMPVWSPDGAFIAYVNPNVTYRVLQAAADGRPVYQVEEKRQEIWLMTESGEHKTRLTNISVVPAKDEQEWLQEVQSRGTGGPQTLEATAGVADWAPLWGGNNEFVLYFVRQTEREKRFYLQRLELRFE